MGFNVVVLNVLLVAFVSTQRSVFHLIIIKILINKENNVFKDAIGVKDLRFKLYGNHHGYHGYHNGNSGVARSILYRQHSQNLSEHLENRGV